MATVAGAPTADTRSRGSALPNALTLAGWLAFLVFAGIVAFVGESAGDALAPSAPSVSVPAAGAAAVAGDSLANAGQGPAHTVGAATLSVAPAPAFPGLPFPTAGFHEI